MSILGPDPPKNCQLNVKKLPKTWVQWKFEETFLRLYDVSPSFDVVVIFGKEEFEKQLTLQALFIAKIKPSFIDHQR